MAIHAVPVVDAFGRVLVEMLQRAEEVKQTSAVDPSLNKSDFSDILKQVESSFFASATTPELRKRIHPAIETAIRDAYNNILASTTIDAPSFVRLWNLLDIISFLADNEQCDTALLFWLVEELLDSQTIAGCRRIFDYLESRRERITARHFTSWNLVVLRSCNELLRRLSRAEDTAFCGRVFIFMFQSYPLGDKSSVNLRGEYHTENVTSYDQLPPQNPESNAEPENMEVDSEQKELPATTKTSTNGTPNAGTPGPESTAISKSKRATITKPEVKTETPMSPDELYPIFWSLQECFNQPKKLFDATKFTVFKKGLEATMVTFRSVQAEAGGRSLKAMDDNKRGMKRKRSHGEDDLASAYNPKYLTSRDLFELEISDLSFRRHILVQVLIVMDFLLSLSTKAKEKLSRAPPDVLNKSVMYADQTLSEEDTEWAQNMKVTIADYLKRGFEGAFFYRMVETVLSRDKNWVRWKTSNCPSISKPSVAPADYLASKIAAKKATTNKRLRPNPLGSLDLRFLSETDDKSGLERLKDPSRYALPSIKSFQSKIEMDDFDIEMENDPEKKAAAIDFKASKSWRALRIASSTKLVAFDKIESSDKISAIFNDSAKVIEATAEDEDDGEAPRELEDRRPIVVYGPNSVGKKTLVRKLVDSHGKVFTKLASHTTRPPKDGEVEGVDKFFVTVEQYNMLRDGDDFLEYSNLSGDEYGTSRKAVESIVAKGKVPIIEANCHIIQQLKDNAFDARYILIQPPDSSIFEGRLRQSGVIDDEKISALIDVAQKEIAQAEADAFHDHKLVNDDLETTFTSLERHIFGDEERSDEQQPAADNTDLVMNDAQGVILEGETKVPLDGDSTAMETTENTVDNNDKVETSV